MENNMNDYEEEGGGVKTLGDTDVLTNTDENGLDSDDAERYAHWVDSEKAAKAKLTGRNVIALCGKVWKPLYDPDKYPICPKCQDIYEKFMK